MTSLWRSRINGFQEPLRMRCLPYFYLIGQPKSGTTDLFYKLNMHPDIAMGTHKEPHWWTRKRFGKKMFTYYKVLNKALEISFRLLCSLIRSLYRPGLYVRFLMLHQYVW